MGLIRYARPVANSLTGTNSWTIGGTGTPAGAFWDAINQPFGTSTVRGSGGGVETDVAQDVSWLRSGGASSRFTVKMAPVCGDDDLLSIVLHARVRRNSGANKSVQFFYRTGGVDYATGGAIATTGFATFTEISLTSSLAPDGFSWASKTNEFASGIEFGLIADANIGSQDCSRFYIEARYAVGITLGRDLRYSAWRYCDECGLKRPYDQMRRPVAPHPQAGLVVCDRCYDQLDHETRKQLAGSQINETDEVLY